MMGTAGESNIEEKRKPIINAFCTIICVLFIKLPPFTTKDMSKGRFLGLFLTNHVGNTRGLSVKITRNVISNNKDFI